MRELETPRQLGERVGLAKTAIERLINGGRIAFVTIGARKYIPAGAWETFIAANTVTPCRDQTADLVSSKTRSEAGSGIFTGQREGAAASAALARETAKRLKLSSPGSSASARGAPGHVIPLKS